MDSICEWPESFASIIPISEDGYAKQETLQRFQRNWDKIEAGIECFQKGAKDPQLHRRGGKEAKPSEWLLEIYEPRRLAAEEDIFERKSH